MGAVNSCCIPRKTFETCRENRISTPKGRCHRRNLSATFNLSMNGDDISDHSQTQLNINSATEEELMTLPGINRSTAQTIIEYRRQIGYFKKVEDLALVSGVGATKLNLIRSEICVSIKRMGNSSSHNSSPAGSKQDLNSCLKDKKRSNGYSPVIVNINTANVFQLMKVKGLGQGLAENIVTYRDKKGPYKLIDDLVKVRGIGPIVLSAIRPHLTLEGTRDLTLTDKSSSSHMNGGIPSIGGGDFSCSNTGTGSSKSSMENLVDILGPFAKKSSRPDILPFKFKRKNRRVFRIATWNLERFTVEKAENPGVRDVVCMTILENGFGIIAVQELGQENALTKICEELNNPSLPNIKKWTGPQGVWKCAVSESTGKMFQSDEYNGFLYDTSQKIELKSASLLEYPKTGSSPFVRKPFIGVFKINKKFDCVVVSVHLKATGLNNEDLDRTKDEVNNVPQLIQAIKDHIPGEQDVIIVGDFNLSPDTEDFKQLTLKGYYNCIPCGTFTNISNNNPSGSKTYDNIWLGSHTQKVYSGHAAVVRDGLSSPWIPKGWSWGGVVSDHCPVYAELYSNKDLDDGDLSIGADGVVFTVGDSS